MSPGLCPDPLPDDIQEEINSLRSQIRWIQGRFDTANAKASHAENALEVSKDRIRELEEAMPDASLILAASAFLADQGVKGAAELLSAYDRIEKVMKKPKEN